MSKSKDADDLDGFAEPDTSGPSNGTDLEPGEHMTAEIVGCNLSAGDNGVVELGETNDDGEVETEYGEVWLNATLRKQLEAAVVRGSELAYRKSDKESSFKNDDGEETTYFERSFLFPQED